MYPIKPSRLLSLNHLLLFLGFLSFSPLIVANEEGRWQKLEFTSPSPGPLEGLSGLARITPPRHNAAYSFLGVLDNRNSDEPRTVMINLDSNFKVIGVIELIWPTGYPDNLKDLESVAAVPNTLDLNQQFVATTSSGRYWRFTINGIDQIDNLLAGEGKLTLSGKNSSAEQIESVAFFVNQSSGNTKIVWSSRGSRDHSARMFAADFVNSSSELSFNDSKKYYIEQDDVKWPRPKWSNDSQTRLVSDLKISNPEGTTYISSAFDGGDDGPFASTLYEIGEFISVSNFEDAQKPYIPLTDLFIRGYGKKVEAIEFVGDSVSNGFILGTDDEDIGSYIMVLKLP
ncbi:MAG: hypothetical protein AAF065_10195 [Verrucomicrobiota bacterium]